VEDPKTYAWHRFAEPAFKEKLWGDFLEHLGARLDASPEGEEQAAGMRSLVGSVVVVLVWVRFRAVYDGQVEPLVWMKDIFPKNSAISQSIGMSLQTWHRRRRIAEASATQIAKTYTEFLINGDSGKRIALEHLISALVKRFEIAGLGLTKRPLIPWHCWAALAALERLTTGTVPTRKQVINGAIECRAAFELMDDFDDQDALASKIADLRKEAPRNWKRIIRQLDLTGLPRTEQRY
jgi:hypothetical protein